MTDNTITGELTTKLGTPDLEDFAVWFFADYTLRPVWKGLVTLDEWKAKGKFQASQVILKLSRHCVAVQSRRNRICRLAWSRRI